MSILTGKLNDTLVYWPPAARDKFAKPGYGTPAEILGRWEDNLELAVTSTGEEFTSHAQVFLDQDLELEGYLFLGDLQDLSTDELSDPRREDRAYEIKKTERVESVGGLDQVRQVWL